MKVGLFGVDGLPGKVVWLGKTISAFVKIGTDVAAVQAVDLMLEKTTERNEQCQLPRCVVRSLA
jgi:hypothetical protein